jgi:hypothetical protein
MSSLALFLTAMLFAAAGLYYWAGIQITQGNPLARDVCSTAMELCSHPEWMGLAAIAMAVAYVALKGAGF